MRGFSLVMNFIVLLVFIGIPALGAASAHLSGNESLDNPPAGWNSVLPGLGDDVLRRAAENTLNLADRFSPDVPPNAEKPGVGLSGPPTHWQRGERRTYL